jgi:hypothetical protein
MDLLIITLEEMNVRLKEEMEEKLEGIDKEFEKDYDNARQQQKWNFWASLSFGVIGATAIILSVIMQSSDVLARTITAIAGGLTMGIGTLIYKRADKANERADDYHTEQLQFRQLRYLFNLTASLPDPEVRSRLQQNCLLAVLGDWFASKEGIVSGAKSDELSPTPSDGLNNKP